MKRIWHDIPCMLFKKIPAAAMIIPMFLSIIFNTIFPDFVKIGSLTTAIFAKSAVVPLTAAVLFFAGTQLKMNEAPEALKRGGDLTSGEIFCGVCCWNTFFPCFWSGWLIGNFNIGRIYCIA